MGHMEAETMADNYFVLYQRDIEGERYCKELAAGRLMYDRYKGFAELREARQFAAEQLHSAPIIARNAFSADFYNEGSSTCVIALHFAYKYSHTSYDGSSDSVPTHEVIRCAASELEGKIMGLAEERPQKMYAGIELKLFGGEMA